jgi:FkbM family methyltransferase
MLGVHRSFRKYVDNAPVKQNRFLGFKVKTFDLRAAEFSFREIFLGVPYFFRTEKERPTIIDCGSNIGISVLFFKTLYPKAQIVAFEPSSTAFSLLKQNLESNRIENVILHQSALTNVEGTVELRSDNPASLTASIVEERAGAYSETVKTVRLSELIDRDIDFLKIDVEGAERLILNDLNESGKLKLVKEMVVEYHHHIDGQKDILSEFLEILEQNNFGYQVQTKLYPPFKSQDFQDILIYAYSK